MILRFGECDLDTSRFELRRRGVVIPIERRVFDLIVFLAQNCERVVSNAEIFEHVWEGRVVAAGSLTVAMSAARRALGDDTTRQEIIRTIKGRGYRLVQPVDITAGSSSSAPIGDLQADFLGRDSELQIFRELLDEQDRHARVISLAGDPGIGKSRLLTEFLSVSHSRGIPTHVARCPESERTPYLWPWATLIGGLAGQRPLDAYISPRQACSISSLFPEHLPGIAEELSADPDAARFQVFEALTALIRNLSGSDRHLLAIDDFHRADETTARFVQFACGELHDVPLILVITYRPREISHDTVHSSAASALARQPHAATLSLQGLTSADTFSLASKLARTTLPGEIAAELHARTSGNPFFIHQLAPILNAEGANLANLQSIPLSLSQAILSRVQQLSAATQELLAIAAVLGRDFSVSLLLSVAAAIPQVEQSLQEASEQGFIAFVAGKANLATFPHVLVRDVLYSQLSIHERRRLHKEVGTLLDSNRLVRSEDRASEVARHLFESGDRSALSRALDLSESAGQTATRRQAHEDAAHHFSLALEALSALPDQDERRRCRLLILKGEAQCRAGNRAAARQAFREAATLAGALGASEDLARAALGVAPGILAAEAGVSDASLETLLVDALRSTEEDAFELRALLAARLAIAIQWSERESAVNDLMEVARQCLTRTDDPRIRMHVLFAEWFCTWKPDAVDTRHHLADEIHDIAVRIADREMSIVGMVLRMVGMLERNDIASFDSALVQFEDLAQLLRQPQSLWYCSMFKGMRSLMDAQLEDAARYQAEFASIASRVGDANAFHSLAAQSALLQWEKGGLQHMLKTLADGKRAYPTIRGFRAGLAWSLMKVGDTRKATAEFEQLAACDFADVPPRYDWSAAIAFAAEVCAALGDQRRAKILLDLLAPYAGKVLVLGLGVANLGATDRILGLLSATLGHVERAEWHFQAALRVSSSNMPAWNAHTKLDYARFQLKTRRTGLQEARRLAREAREYGRSIGMKSLEQDALGLAID